MICTGTYTSGVRTGKAVIPSGSVIDPKGSSSGSFRVLRGGSWSENARYCRSAFRGRSTPSSRLDGLGFRLACRAFAE